MTTLDTLLRTKGMKTNRRVNNRLIPCYTINNTVEGAHEFNTYYSAAYARYRHLLTRTPSRGISIAKNNVSFPSWEVRYNTSMVEMTILDIYSLRIQFRQVRNEADEEQQIYGRQAFVRLWDLLEKDGVRQANYMLKDKAAGWSVKQTIPNLLIKADSPMVFDKVFPCCHHIDFHNSFPAGLCNKHPEFRNVIDKIYTDRKKHPINKAILNYSIGFCQSEGCDYRLSNLTKDAISDNNDRVLELAKRVAAAGNIILLYNTDGFWYFGKEPYHGEGEGSGLGQWENDHTYCRFRAKSAGAYEYVENGVYQPVVRGRTNLDFIKPRTEWEWGDIYKKEAKPIMFLWEEGRGLVDENNNIV